MERSLQPPGSCSLTNRRCSPGSVGTHTQVGEAGPRSAERSGQKARKGSGPGRQVDSAGNPVTPTRRADEPCEAPPGWRPAAAAVTRPQTGLGCPAFPLREAAHALSAASCLIPPPRRPAPPGTATQARRAPSTARLHRPSSPPARCQAEEGLRGQRRRVGTSLILDLRPSASLCGLGPGGPVLVPSRKRVLALSSCR